VPGVARIGRAFRVVSSAVVKRMTSPKYAGVLEYGHDYGGAYLLRRGMYMPWELPELLDADLVREGWRELRTRAELERTAHALPDGRLRISALEATWYMRNQLLRDTDWASMSHSLEVRVPLVDHVLLAALAPMISHMQSPDGKTWLAKSPQRELPPLHWQREKTGFSTPLENWLASVTELDTYRRVPLLARDGCQWARRYAYVVQQRVE
jgi:asparagine synthase (glutamine-hydrolysing)